MVRCRFVSIQRRVAWSVCTKNGCSAPCRLNFQYNAASQMSISSLSYAGYCISVFCNFPLKSPSTFSSFSSTWESTAPTAYWLASTCRHYLALGSGRARTGALQSAFLRVSKACWHSLSQANGERMTFFSFPCHHPTSPLPFGGVAMAYNGMAM